MWLEEQYVICGTSTAYLYFLWPLFIYGVLKTMIIWNLLGMESNLRYRFLQL